VLYPCDGNATAALVETMADLPGISYVRTTREKTPALYEPGEGFPIGGSKTLRSSDDDRVTLVGAGITVHEALAAAEALAADGIEARVIDCYSIKPIDADAIQAAVSETGLLLTIEDHWIEGGLGDAVLAALAARRDPSGTVVKIAVTEMPGSGTPEELREWAGISAGRIADRVRSLLG
jgi:transketolase